MNAVHGRVLEIQPEDKADPRFGLLDAWTIAAAPAMEYVEKFSRMLRFQFDKTQLHLMFSVVGGLLGPHGGDKRVWSIKATPGGGTTLLIALENLRL
jgi:hypothetical protein